MPYTIAKHGEKFCVVKKDGGKSFGCHATRAEAEKQMAAIYSNERRLTVAATGGYTTRIEQHNSREHLVVPVVGLVEGVVHPLNAKDGPEFVPVSTLTDRPERWTDKPIFEGHPLVDGKPVKGDNKFMREQRSVGLVRNPDAINDKLTMEAWLDTELCGRRAPELLARARAGEPIEISVGVLVATEQGNGEYKGRTYAHTWAEMEPDHLALLPEGVLGACSLTAGCGVRAMQDAQAADWVVEALYSDDQPRDEKGMFAAAVEAHKSAAAAHTKAAASLSGADKGGPKATSHSIVAHAETDVANEHSNALTKTPHGDRAKEHAKNAREARRKGEHAKAAEHHIEAAKSHSSLAKLIAKAGKLEEKIRNAEEADVDHMYLAWLEDGADITALRNIPQSVRDKMDKVDFAGPNESFPIEIPGDVHDAASSLGRAKGDRAAIKRKIIAIAYRKGDSFVAQLPDAWKKKSDMKAASGFARLMETVKAAFRGGQDADEMGNNDLRRRLYEAIRDYEPNLMNVDDYFPVTDPSHVVYTCYDGMDFTTWERSFTLADTGVVTISDQKIEVEQITKWEPVEGTSPSLLEKNEGTPAPSSDTKPAGGETDMKSEKVTKFLETATDCQVKALEAFVEGGAKPVEPVKQPTEAELKAAADARAKEINDAVTAAIAADRKSQNELRVAGEKRAAAVKTLEGYGYEAKALEGKSQEVLDGMVEAATKVKPQAQKEERAAVDFGGQGGPKGSNDSPKEPPAAPDLRAAILAKQGKK